MIAVRSRVLCFRPGSVVNPEREIYAAGFSLDDTVITSDSPFLVGFGNNWIDRGNEERYRAYYAFPGAELNELASAPSYASAGRGSVPLHERAALGHARACRS
jgi:hypothetical protein